MSVIPIPSVNTRYERLAELKQEVETSHELEWQSAEEYTAWLGGTLDEMQEHKAVLATLEAAEDVLAQVEQKARLQTQSNIKTNGGFRSFGEFLCAVHDFGNVKLRPPRMDSRLVDESGQPFKGILPPHDHTKAGWVETKQIVESVGAAGGFLVFPEYRAELFAMQPLVQTVRQRATVIPMRSRQLLVPGVLQTATTAGQAHWFGGIIARWTEEATEKHEDEPQFRQIELVAHKLVCYTRASDEMLADAAIGLEAFLRSPMGFTGAINWYEEFAFLQGTGAGQPLGVITALAAVGLGPTITVARTAVLLNDLVNMLAACYGKNPVWHISRSQYAALLLLNGPAANPSYVFIPSAREGVPDTLFGYPIFWTEQLPLAGTTGDILLADWSYYYIGDRQATTIDSSNHEYFRSDLTSWRAVHRVDGQPALNAPITYQDGTTQVSPFVVLGAAAS